MESTITYAFNVSFYYCLSEDQLLLNHSIQMAVELKIIIKLKCTILHSSVITLC